jgi:hypothetical protein
MRERLPKIRASQHGSDPLWKSEKRRRRSKTGDAVGRARWRSSFLGAPGVEFFAERGRSLERRMGSTSGAPKFLGTGTGATSPPSQDSPYPGETERKFKILQVCPRNLSH